MSDVLETGRIAAPTTYVGQNQPIGGPENTANPPDVNVAGFPAGVAVEVVGGALNTATPPDVLLPQGAEIVGGALNTATPPIAKVIGTEGDANKSTIQPIGGATNTANPPTVKISPTSGMPTYPADSAAIDAFSRQRVSQPNGLFDGKFRFDKLPLLFDEFSTAKASGSGTVTHIPADACVQLEVTATGTFKAPAMMSHQRFLYRAGQSLLILQTFETNPSGAPMVSGLTKRIGFYDKRTGGNGLYLQLSYDAADLLDLTAPSFVVASTSSAGGETVTQANWNVDKLDGTGASGITLNFNYCQILVMDLQFLGVGRVRWGFDINGVIYWAHYSNHANIAPFNSTYMQTACLPVRFEMFGNNVNGKFNVICNAVIREGGLQEPAYKGNISTESVSAAGQAFPNVATGSGSTLLAIRLKSGFLGAYFKLNDLTVTNTSNQQVYWEAMLVRGLPATSLLFTWVSLDDATEYSTTQVTKANLAAALVDGIQVRLDSGILLSSGGQRTSFQTSTTAELLQVAAANNANEASGGATAASMDILLVQGRGMGGAGTGHVSIGIDEYY